MDTFFRPWKIRQHISIHESGHAVVACLQGLRVITVEVYKKGGGLTHRAMGPQDDFAAEMPGGLQQRWQLNLTPFLKIPNLFVVNIMFLRKLRQT